MRGRNPLSLLVAAAVGFTVGRLVSGERNAVTAPGPAKPKQDTDAVRTQAQHFLSSFIAAQSAYHAHKETTTYWAVGLYIAGATWIVTTKSPAWSQYTPLEFSCLLAFVSALSVSGCVFVWWQLDQRREAAIHVAAAYNLACQWLEAPTLPTRNDLQVRPAAIHRWPEVLRRAMDDVAAAQARELRLRRGSREPSSSGLVVLPWCG